VATSKEKRKMKLSISKIKIDEQLYPRAHMDPEHISRLTAALQAGAHFPPIVVEAKTYRLVDGRNRCEAHKGVGIKTIEAIEKVYRNEADFFADAVRLNASHGQPLDAASTRSAIIRLYSFGYSKEVISELIRVPADHLEMIRRGFDDAKGNGKPIAVKGDGEQPVISEKRKELIRKFAGEKAMFYVRQLVQMLEEDVHPKTRLFHDTMNDLMKWWNLVKANSPN
jgi:hypothetical protein